MKRVIAYRQQCLKNEREDRFLAVCLSARRNMCIHPRAVAEEDGENVDTACRKMTVRREPLHVWLAHDVEQQRAHMT